MELSLEYILTDPELNKMSSFEIKTYLNRNDYDKDFDHQAAYEVFVDMK